MKAFAISSLVAAIAVAVDSETLSAIMMPTNTAFENQFARNTVTPLGRSHGSPINLSGSQSRTANFNSNKNDNDLRRQFPDFASPFRKGEMRPMEQPDLRMGEELIPLAQRQAAKAVKDPVLAIAPRAHYNEKAQGMEPLEPKDKKFLSPVFLVDPAFTKK